MTRTLLTEARPTAEASATAVDGKPGRFLLQLITPGWGSSGYYSPEVLKAAAEAKVFPAGLHSYLDHEHADGSGIDMNGNRSVKDLASTLAEDARWDESLQALVAEANVFGPYRHVLKQMKEAIGLSITAYAETSVGEAEGRRGVIIDELVEGRTADYVNHAGRGGKILEVLESARPVEESRNIGQWIESRIHRDFTITADDMAGDGRLTREERIGLSSAIGDALAAFVSSLEANQPQLYTRDLWDDPQDTIAAAIEAATTHVPAVRSDEPSKQEANMPEIAESELRTLREAAGRVETLESELSTEREGRESAERERDQLKEAGKATARTNRAREIITARATEAGVEFNPREVKGFLADIKVTESGDLDEAALTKLVDDEATSVKESQGAGKPRNLGRTTPPTPEAVTESDLDALDDAVFGKIKEA